jgi:hypothetical protein
LCGVIFERDIKKLMQHAGQLFESINEIVQSIFGALSRESVQHAGRLADLPISLFSFAFGVHWRMLFASVRCIAEAADTHAITVFYVLTKVLGLRFHHWRWVSHLLSDNQKSDRA